MPSYSEDELYSILRPLPRTIRRGRSSIPFVPKSNIDLCHLNDGVFLEGFQNCSWKDKNQKHKIVHGFLYDHELEALYRHPKKYISLLAKYYAVMTPDFSIYRQMDEFNITAAVYKNRYLGALWASFGIRVIPTVGWTIPKYDDICFEGIYPDSTVSISSLGIRQKEECKKTFLAGLKTLEQRLKPRQIICLGDPLEEMRPYDNIFYVPYDQSFGNQFQTGWQGRLFWYDEKGEIVYGL